MPSLSLSVEGLDHLLTPGGLTGDPVRDLVGRRALGLGLSDLTSSLAQDRRGLVRSQGRDLVGHRRVIGDFGPALILGEAPMAVMIVGSSLVRGSPTSPMSFLDSLFSGVHRFSAEDGSPRSGVEDAAGVEGGRVR